MKCALLRRLFWAPKTNIVKKVAISQGRGEMVIKVPFGAPVLISFEIKLKIYILFYTYRDVLLRVL